MIDPFEDVKRHELSADRRSSVVFTMKLSQLQGRILRLLNMRGAYETLPGHRRRSRYFRAWCTQDWANRWESRWYEPLAQGATYFVIPYLMLRDAGPDRRHHRYDPRPDQAIE
jgi:hypothetical protein